jgi:signal transduction histidine kinase
LPTTDPDGISAIPASDDEAVQRLMSSLMEANNEMAVLHRDLAGKSRALQEAIAQKNQFLGMAAHDLRNPLSVIGGMSKVLLRSVNVNDKERRLLESINGSALFMQQLVDDLLNVTEFQAVNFELRREPLVLPALLEERVEVARMLAAPKQIAVTLRLPRVRAQTNADRMRLTQLLDNLLSNAIKYSPVSTEVMVHLHCRDGCARISVRDCGVGIPANEMQKLFLPFSVTSARSTGGEKSTGLGLVIVKRIAEAHGGEVKARSRVGRGTTFHVMLPIDTAATG